MPSPSINLIKASDGTGNAAMATVQSTRAPLATTLIVDTVDNIPATFIGTMGTPHTFVDPITAEEIVVISEATTVDFTGHVDGTNLEIDTIAPGFTDLGSSAGDVIIIRPTTEWANNMAAVLDVAHNDDGTLKSVVANQGWTDVTGTTVTAVAANGNRSCTMTVNQDLRTTLSPGMRLRTTRTVAAPTQCTSLNGTTQYYSCASANLGEMTFTDDFVAGAWIKLSSYSAGAIISRYNGTNGWILRTDSNGAIAMYGYNGASGNNSFIGSYQSIPLNKWVYVVAQLDMSAFTASSTTSYIMIDGVDVPAVVGRQGTNPTALVQAGNLEVGSFNGGAAPFNGKIAQAFVSSAKITQANVRTLMSQGLTASLISTHSIVSAYSFDNAITDLNTTSANNLTANGSAVATNADSPFGGQGDGTISSTLDYGIVQAVSASTVTVQVAEGCTIPTSGGVSAVSYSTQKVPFNFPGDKAKWTIFTHNRTLNAKTTPTDGQCYYTEMGSQRISIPIGKWVLSGVQLPNAARGSAGIAALYWGISTTTSSMLNCSTDGRSSSDYYYLNSGASINTILHRSEVNNIPYTATAMTDLYVVGVAVGTGISTIELRNDINSGITEATNAYL